MRCDIHVKWIERRSLRSHKYVYFEDLNTLLAQVEGEPVLGQRELLYVVASRCVWRMKEAMPLRWELMLQTEKPSPAGGQRTESLLSQRLAALPRRVLHM